MRTLSPSAFKSVLLALATTLVFTACSRLGLAYRNLDVLIPWWVDKYLDMTPEQEQRFDAQLREHLRWHCRTQLPLYLDWLEKLRVMLETGQVTPGKLAARLAEAKKALAVIATEITPSTVELLRGLDERQVSELFAALDEDMLKRREKYLELTPQEQIEQRAMRMEKRLSPWLGRLNPMQRQRVKRWSESLDGLNQQRLDNRAHWQAELRAAIAQRQAANFPKRIARLLQRRERLWSDDYRQALARAEQAVLELLVEVLAQADDKQRSHLLRRLSDLHLEFSALRCLHEPQE